MYNTSIQARQQSLDFPRYAWIIYGWYSNDWWISTNDEVLSQCSNEELRDFLSDARVIALQPYPMSENMNNIIVGGIVSMCRCTFVQNAMFTITPVL